MSSYTPPRSSDALNELEHDVASVTKKVSLVGGATSGLATEATLLLIKTATELLDNIVNTHDSVVGSSGSQSLSEAKDFDGAALPNGVAEGDAVRPAASLSGVAYVMPVSEDGAVSPIDPTTGYSKGQEQSPLSEQYTAKVPLVSASDIGAVNNTWVDQGAEIACNGYTQIGIWVNFTVNDSTGNQLQVLSKHTSAGSDEYVLESASKYQKTIGNSSLKILYMFEVDNTFPYIQIQSKATTVGATEGTLTIDITKGWA